MCCRTGDVSVWRVTAREVWWLLYPLWHSLRVCFMIVEPWKVREKTPLLSVQQRSLTTCPGGPRLSRFLFRPDHTRWFHRLAPSLRKMCESAKTPGLISNWSTNLKTCHHCCLILRGCLYLLIEINRDTLNRESEREDGCLIPEWPVTKGGTWHWVISSWLLSKSENPHAVTWTINSRDIQLSAVAGKQPGI